MEDLVGVITKRVIVQVVVKSLLMEYTKMGVRRTEKLFQDHQPVRKAARFVKNTVKETVKKSSETAEVQLALFE